MPPPPPSGGANIKQKLAFGGPLISMNTEKKNFTKKLFQSGPNLKSFAFNRGGRVDLRAPKAIGGPKNWVGAQKKRGGGAKIRKWLCFFWFPLFLGGGPKIRSFCIISTPGEWVRGELGPIYFIQKCINILAKLYPD